MQGVVVDERHYPGTGQSPPLQHFSARAITSLIVPATLWFLLCRELSGEWSVNEQYSYGWFVPFFALFLFWLRWEGRPGRESRKEEVGSRKWIVLALGVSALLLLFRMCLFEILNQVKRSLDLMHYYLYV